MDYSPELFYLHNPDFPLEKTLRVTALATAQWSTHYKARLITGKKGVTEKKKEGVIPPDESERIVCINSLIDWIFTSSHSTDLFTLFLSKDKTADQKEVIVFNHHDDTCCWFLDLTEEQFKALQTAWKNADLPEDLFYSGDGHQEGWHYYTPKQWKAKQDQL